MAFHPQCGIYWFKKFRKFTWKKGNPIWGTCKLVHVTPSEKFQVFLMLAIDWGIIRSQHLLDQWMHIAPRAQHLQGCQKGDNQHID